MKTYKQYDIKEFEELEEKVARATEDNCHSEALVMIADFFGYPEYYDLFESYSKKESLTMTEWNARYSAQVRMFFVIEAEYGQDTVLRLLAAL